MDIRPFFSIQSLSNYYRFMTVASELNSEVEEGEEAVTKHS